MEGSERNRYILFWKPKLEIENFYLHYEGEEIRELETLLMVEGLYRYDLDGLVGPKLMTAVNRFQRQNGLPVTGFPDSQTIFLLCQVTKKDTHE
jgi:peptidoglycan hydrolase-like protein with peptidoglycan-binding domain